MLLKKVIRAARPSFIFIFIYSVTFPEHLGSKVTRRTVRSPLSFAFWHIFASSKSSANTQTNLFRSFNNSEVVRSQREGRRMIQKKNDLKKSVSHLYYYSKTWRTKRRMKQNNHHRHRPLKPPPHSLPPPTCTFQPI